MKASHHGIEGWVDMSVTFCANGNVALVNVCGSTHQFFLKAALSAVQMWRYDRPEE